MGNGGENSDKEIDEGTEEATVQVEKVSKVEEIKAIEEGIKKGLDGFEDLGEEVANGLVLIEKGQNIVGDNCLK